MAPAWLRISGYCGMLVAALAGIGCEEDEIAPPRAPNDVAPVPSCVEGAPAPAPPPVPMSLAAFTPERRPPTIVIRLDGLVLYSDTPEGAWLRGVQPPTGAQERFSDGEYR